MGVHRFLGILILGVALTTTAQAQRLEAFGSVGYGRTFRLEDFSPGEGVVWGFGAGFRPTPRMRVEAAIENLDVLSHPTDHVANMLYPRASVAYEFSAARIRPFVIGGGGVAHIREVLTVTFPTREEIREEKETAFALHFGGGVSLQIQPRLAIRPQLVLVTPIGSRSNVNLLSTSVQVAFSW